MRTDPIASDRLVVGIDISKLSYEICYSVNGQLRCRTVQADQMDALVSELAAAAPALIVMEATGRYHQPLARALLERGLLVSAVNPRWVHAFAKSIGQLAKTDRTDARVLAHFGRAVSPRTLTRLTEQQCLLDELMMRRRQLVQMLAQERNRREQATRDAATRSIARVIRTLESELREIDAEFDVLIDSEPDLKRVTEILRSVSGVGDVTARVLVTEVPELGTMNRRQIAALLGLAPKVDQSGRRDGVRRIMGGRRDPRKALYMAALSASQHNPLIRRERERLQARSKPFKVWMVACMRKLAVLLNTLVAEDRLFDPTRHLASA